MRRTGIEVVGDVPWGTHFCQFYETSQDLLDVLVPYFREGLAANEYCMWVTSAPLEAAAAKAALRACVPGIDESIAQGRIEILDHRDWYLRSGKFSADEVLQGWVTRLDAARLRGFAGLRLTGNTFWLEASAWKDFARYEEKINSVIGQYPMLALCTYSLARCGANEILDVVANHEFALVKRDGRWTCVENSGQRRLAAELRQSEERFRAFMRNSPAIAWMKDSEGRYVYLSESFEKHVSAQLKDWQGKTDEELWPAETAEEFRRNDLEVLTKGQAVTLVEQTPDAAGGQRSWLSSKFPFRDAAGKTYVGGIGVDVTERRQLDARAHRQNALLVAINRILSEALSCKTEEHLGRVCLAVAEELTMSQLGFIAEIGPDGRLNDVAISELGWDACRVEHRTGHGKPPTGFPISGVFGRVVLGDKGFFSNEPFPHPGSAGLPQGHPRVEAFLGVPLIHEAKTIGMIALANRQGGYRDEDLDAMEMLAPAMVQALMRKRAEEALARSERRTALIIDSIADGFFALDREWRFVRVNDVALRHFGKTSEELLGRTLLDVFPMARGTVFETAYRAAMESGEPTRFESASMIDGRALEVYVYPGSDNLTVLFRDVTERKQAEAKLRETHERAAWLARFPEENPNPVLRVSADGSVLYRNPASDRLLGWTCQVGGAAPEALLPLLARAMAERGELREDVTAGDRVYSVSAVPFAEEGYANVYGIDITARRRAEDALRKTHDELEERVRERTAELRELNATLQMISDCNQAQVRASTEIELVRQICRIIQDRGGHRMAWVGYALDDEAKTVQPVASAGAEDGYLDRAHITWNDDDHGGGPTGTCIRTRTLCHSRDFLSDPAMAPWREEALKRGFRSSIALPLILDGRAFGALTIYSGRVGDFDAQQVKLLSELADDLAFGIMAVRARHTAEERASQLAALATQLGQAEERERRRLATVLHDHLQQLLVGARYALATIDGAKHSQKQRNAIEELEQILDTAIEASTSLTADLSPPVLHEKGLVAGLQSLARQMKQKHGLRVDMSADPLAEPGAESVRVLLYQAVRELLFNVVKHARVRQARVRIGRLDRCQIQVIVEDRGAGFQPERIDVGGAGSGFGLFSIRERLNYLGGRMTIESVVGRGSRFTLVAPALAANAGPETPMTQGTPPTTAGAPAAKDRTAGATPSKIRVLLADDHPVMREGLARLLGEQPDIEVVGQAADGSTALDMAAQLQPDVVLMDVSMPRLSGLEATRHLAVAQPGVRVIGLSMHEDAAMGGAMREAGAVAYVAKSAPPAEVLTAIRSHANSAAVSEPPSRPPRRVAGKRSVRPRQRRRTRSK